MNSTDTLTSTPTDRIIHALAFGERTKGELLDASGLKSHAELDKVLAQMGDKITLHWGEGCRTYRLAEVKPSAPWWMLPKPPE